MSGILTDVVLELKVSSIIDKQFTSPECLVFHRQITLSVLVFFKDYKIAKGLISIVTYERKKTIFDPV